MNPSRLQPRPQRHVIIGRSVECAVAGRMVDLTTCLVCPAFVDLGLEGGLEVVVCVPRDASPAWGAVTPRERPRP